MVSVDLSSLVAQRATEAERLGRLTNDVVAALHESGVYRNWIPTAYGGVGTTAADGLDCIRALSSHDGAVGWCAMVANTTSLLGHFLPIEVAQEIYGPPQAVTGGAAQPMGTAAANRDDQLVVNGRWQWGSGTAHCTHIGGGCRVTDRHGEQLGGTHFVFFDRSDVEIHDTWQVMGLAGTGSNDYEVKNLLVQEGFSVEMGVAPPVADDPLARFSLFGLLAAGVASVSVGIAQRAIAELTAMAVERTPQGSSRTLAARASTQIELAKATATVDASWGYLLDAVDNCWHHAEIDGSNSLEQRLQLRSAATDAARRCADTVRQLYLTAGGEAVYLRGDLQKQFRDIHVATQHAMIAERTYELVGRAKLGFDIDPRLL